MGASNPRGPLSQDCHDPGSGWAGRVGGDSRRVADRAALTRCPRTARSRKWQRTPIPRLPNWNLGLGRAAERAYTAFGAHELLSTAQLP